MSLSLSNPPLFLNKSPYESVPTVSTSMVLAAVQLHDLARQRAHVPRGHPADRFDQNRDLAFFIGRVGGLGQEDEQVIGRIELELAVGVVPRVAECVAVRDRAAIPARLDSRKAWRWPGGRPCRVTPVASRAIA